MAKQTLSERLSEATETISALQTQSGDLQAQVERLTSELEAANNATELAIGERTALETERSSLLSANETLQAEIDAARAELAQVQERVEALEAITRVLPGHRNIGGDHEGGLPGSSGQESEGDAAEIRKQFEALKASPGKQVEAQQFWKDNEAALILAYQS